MAHEPLPYFDFLLKRLAREDQATATSFGRHVHWGYWESPATARCDAADYSQAAEQLTLELCKLADIQPNQQVLDVGCGFGGTVASINERLTGMDLTGLNIDARQLQRARELVRPVADNRIAFCQGDACSLPYGGGTYERMLAVECIFHFPSRERFFMEAARTLKPGGILALSDFVPAPWFLPVVASIGHSAWFTRLNFFGYCDVGHTLRRYHRLARQAGLQVHGERNITAHTLPTYRYLKHLLGDGPRLAGIPATRLVDLLSLLGKSGALNYYLLAFRKP